MSYRITLILGLKPQNGSTIVRYDSLFIKLFLLFNTNVKTVILSLYTTINLFSNTVKPL
jgi:hypothetical protein